MKIGVLVLFLFLFSLTFISAQISYSDCSVYGCRISQGTTGGTTYNNNSYFTNYYNLTGNWINASSTTCGGTDKISAYDNATGLFTCSADQTGGGGNTSAEIFDAVNNGTFYLASNPNNYINTSGGNSSFNEAYTNTLYMKNNSLNTTQFDFINSIWTIRESTWLVPLITSLSGGNSSWTEAYARTLFPLIFDLNNYVLWTSLVGAVGNWSADKSSYYTKAETNTTIREEGIKLGFNLSSGGGNTTQEIFNAVNNFTWYLNSNPSKFINSSANNSYVLRGSANQTWVDCSNITGATSNLCTITSSGGMNYTYVVLTNETLLNNTINSLTNSSSQIFAVSNNGTFYLLSNPSNYWNWTSYTNCSAGQFAVNFTRNGFQCLTPASGYNTSAEIFAVSNNGTFYPYSNPSNFVNGSYLNITDQRYNETNWVQNNYYNITKVNDLIPSLLTYYFWDVSSSVNTSLKIMNVTQNPNPTTLSANNLADGDTVVYRVNDNTNLTSLNGGMLHLHTTADKTGGTKDLQLKGELYKRFLNETIVLIGTTDTSPILVTGVPTNIFLAATINQTSMNVSDTLLWRLVAVVSGAVTAPSVDITVGGTTNNGLDLPVSVSAIQGLKGDTGAAGTNGSNGTVDYTNVFLTNQTNSINVTQFVMTVARLTLQESWWESKATAYITKIFVKALGFYEISEVYNKTQTNQTINSYLQQANSSYLDRSNLSYAVAGNCSAGQFAVNITNSGVQCLTPSSTGGMNYTYVVTTNDTILNLTIAQEGNRIGFNLTNSTAQIINAVNNGTFVLNSNLNNTINVYLLASNGSYLSTVNVSTDTNISNINTKFFNSNSTLAIWIGSNNRTSLITNLTDTDCVAGTLVIGVNTNGTVICATDTGGGMNYTYIILSNETILNNTILQEGLRIGFNNTYNASYDTANSSLTGQIIGNNRTNFLTNLTLTDCVAGTLVIGVNDNGTVVCATDQSGASGNYFNQQLNTTMNVTFNNLTITTNISTAQLIFSSFGEWIDNIIDGIIRIFGGLRVEGSINASSGIYYNNGTKVLGTPDNQTSYITNLSAFDCPANFVANGVNTNGTIVCVADAGGGNYFNQQLNTTSNVQFGNLTVNNITATGNIIVSVGNLSVEDKINITGNSINPTLYFGKGGYIYDNGTALILGHI